MDLIKAYYKRNDTEISSTDFERLATSEESNLIERKSLKSRGDLSRSGVKKDLKAMLGKQLSAFANHGGGFLLLGVDDADGKIEYGIATKIGNQGLKEWLEDSLYKAVTPPHVNFSVKKIAVAGDDYVYMVVIKGAKSVPCQAAFDGSSSYDDGTPKKQKQIKRYKNKYFSRVSSKSEPIDGMLVADIFRRSEYADVELQVNYDLFDETNSVHNANLTIVMNVITKIPAESAAIWLSFDEHVINRSSGGDDHYVTSNSCYKRLDLLYPDIPQKIFKLPLRKGDFGIAVVCVAKNMLKKEWKRVIKGGRLVE